MEQKELLLSGETLEVFCRKTAGATLDVCLRLHAGGLCSLHYGQNKPRLITTSDPESRGGKKVEIYGMKPDSDKFEIMSLKFPSRKFSQEDSGLLLSHPKIFWAQGHFAQPAAWYRLGESPCAQVKAFSRILFVNYAIFLWSDDVCLCQVLCL